MSKQQVGAQEIRSSVDVKTDLLSTTRAVHIVALITDWDVFLPGAGGCDWAEVYKHMAKPAWIFDGRRCLDQKSMRQIGFNIFTIGQGVRQD